MEVYLIGDSFVFQANWFLGERENLQFRGIPGCPINSHSLLSIIESTRTSLQVLFPATPLNGSKDFQGIESLMPKPPSQRFVTYATNEDGFILQPLSAITPIQYELLCKNYAEILTYLLDKYPRLCVVPFGVRFYAPRMPRHLRSPDMYNLIQETVPTNRLLGTEISLTKDEDGHGQVNPEDWEKLIQVCLGLAGPENA